ncbi:unnamed protein product [Cylicocyclus nassatus]|uniref:Uncharacterized protein n=1 Tax=Cylicocyclus nassatus TaxID=53992 RepID=A0AA36GQ27_CYLNA|nr:unnamed protein product [Cylicocyclus nassatus]
MRYISVWRTSLALWRRFQARFCSSSLDSSLKKSIGNRFLALLLLHTCTTQFRIFVDKISSVHISVAAVALATGLPLQNKPAFKKFQSFRMFYCD